MPDPYPHTGREAVARLHKRLPFDVSNGIRTEADAIKLAFAEATAALDLLCTADAVEPAEAVLRDGLTRSLPLPAVGRACLLNDLALCHLHDGRAAEAAGPLRHALAVLPSAPPPSARPADVGPSGPFACGAWALRTRAQVQLNLCEALLLSRDLHATLDSAREAVRLCQLAMHVAEATVAATALPTCLARALLAASAPSGSLAAAAQGAPLTGRLGPPPATGIVAKSGVRRRQRGVSSLGASTPRLFTARWLVPSLGELQPSAALVRTLTVDDERAESAAAAPAPRDFGVAVGGAPSPSDKPRPPARPPEGCLGVNEQLLMGWLWCALAHEGLGSVQDSLVAYQMATQVAHVDAGAALASKQAPPSCCRRLLAPSCSSAAASPPSCASCTSYVMHMHIVCKRLPRAQPRPRLPPAHEPSSRGVTEPCARVLCLPQWCASCRRRWHAASSRGQAPASPEVVRPTTRRPRGAPPGCARLSWPLRWRSVAPLAAAPRPSARWAAWRPAASPTTRQWQGCWRRGGGAQSSEQGLCLHTSPP